jgi:polyadenylate-binding protein 2
MSSETEVKPKIEVESVEDETDIKDLEAQIAAMEEEAARIQAEADHLKQESDQAATTNTNHNTKMDTSGNDSNAVSTEKDKETVDSLSIYVGQVDYSATAEELVAHFEPCGAIERVTINCDKFTGKPKGFAYLEFQTEEAVVNALKLDGSTFKNRTLKVTRKRVNDPNFYYEHSAQAASTFMGRGGRGGGRGVIGIKRGGMMYVPRTMPPAHMMGRGMPYRGGGGPPFPPPPGRGGRGGPPGRGRGPPGRGRGPPGRGRGPPRGGPAYHPYY